MPAGAYTSLTVRHIAAQKEVNIPVRVNNYTQDTKPNFASTQVYARMDPIFTYQNTVRTFQITCATPLIGELAAITAGLAATHPLKKLKTALDKISKGSPTTTPPGGTAVAAALYNNYLVESLSGIYQVMYPVYQQEIHGTGTDKFITRQLKAPPILRIQVPKVLNGAASGDSLIFVPETFNVTTGLANASQVQMTITGPSDLKYLAPVGGFGFTLGGTILHIGTAPSFIYDEETKTLNFSKAGFPLGASAALSSKLESVLGDNND